MMTSSRPHGDAAGNFTSRRGHSSQLSISDPTHHVTEAIGTLYGEEEDSGSEGGRPLSFIGGSPYAEQIQRPLQIHRHQHQHQYQYHQDHGQMQRQQQQQQQQQQHRHQEQQEPRDSRRPLARSISDQPLISSASYDENPTLRKTQTLPLPTPSQRSSSYDNSSKPPLSPALSLRDVQADSSGSQFPLTNIDNPNDIAQELSNLQALRRLSMDVGYNIDPDMPPMSLSAIPAIAPTGDDDENDPSRLLWVPARVHPELAPTEFKSFLEKRVQSIRRRSGDSLLSAEGDSSLLDSGASNFGALSRKKSMLSRQIDNAGGRGAVGYVDGADRLGRQRSRGSRASPELSLDELVKDPAKAVQRLAQESQGQQSGPEGNDDDMPILPMAPGIGLRRSTRTTYRKGGSLRSRDKGAFSRRPAPRQQDEEATEASALPPINAPGGHTLSRVQSEPIRENYSRPTRSVRRQQKFSQDSPAATSTLSDSTQDTRRSPHVYGDEHNMPSSSNSSHIEAMTPDETLDHQDMEYQRSYPQRSSSQTAVSQPEPQPEHALEGPPTGSNRQPPSNSNSNSNSNSKQSALQQQPSPRPSGSAQAHTVSDVLGATPSPFPGGGATHTDSLTFIPTASQEEKKPDKKTKKDRDDDSIGVSSKSGSAWKWFKGVTDDKDKKKEESKKSKSKALAEKSQDNTRLDVIQTSIDKSGVKGRESLALDRDNIDSRLQEERRKEGNRKSDFKKEKDGNIFSSLFGGSKRKEEKEKSAKKSQHLQVPEHPPYKPLQPDVDYNWSRFPLLEERAIYRMAHIKLANPRRSLQSQVLLSNFMYSYLAIVQAMHPQMNVPVSPQQKRLEEEARRKQQEEEYMADQQMHEDQDAQQSLDQYNFDYHRATVQYADSGSDGQVDYVDEAQIYEDEHGKDHRRDYAYNNSEGYGQDAKEYFQSRDNGEYDRRGGRDETW